MARTLICLSVVAVLLGGCISVHESKQAAGAKPTATYVDTGTPESAQMLQRMILLQFTEVSRVGGIRKIDSAYCALPARVDVVRNSEWRAGDDVETV